MKHKTIHSKAIFIKSILSIILILLVSPTVEAAYNKKYNPALSIIPKGTNMLFAFTVNKRKLRELRANPFIKEKINALDSTLYISIENVEMAIGAFYDTRKIANKSTARGKTNSNNGVVSVFVGKFNKDTVYKDILTRNKNAQLKTYSNISYIRLSNANSIVMFNSNILVNAYNEHVMQNAIDLFLKKARNSILRSKTLVRLIKYEASGNIFWMIGLPSKKEIEAFALSSPELYNIRYVKNVVFNYSSDKKKDTLEIKAICKNKKDALAAKVSVKAFFNTHLRFFIMMGANNNSNVGAALQKVKFYNRGRRTIASIKLSNRDVKKIIGSFAAKKNAPY